MEPLLYLKDIESCYLKEFRATILETGHDGDDFIVMDRTVFYPLGGGQPADTGTVAWEYENSEVKDVRKNGPIRHYIIGPVPPVGTVVEGKLDWAKRYAHMRMHTAQHLISSVVWKRYKARTVGNQIHHDRSHIDFYPLKAADDLVSSIQNDVNGLVSSGAHVTIDFRKRGSFEGLEDVERLDMDRIPKDISVLRTVVIGEQGEIDICPCAGTHVRKLDEIGAIKVIDVRSKGKGKLRLEYILS